MRSKLEIMKERRKALERKKEREHLTEALLQKRIRAAIPGGWPSPDSELWDALKKTMPSVFPRLNW